MTMDQTTGIATLEPRPDDKVLRDVREWIRMSLGCVAGRREFVKDRYLIEIACRSTVVEILSNFKTELYNYRKIACLLIFNNPEYYMESGASTFDSMSDLSDQMAVLTNQPASELLNGGALNLRILVPCPVTGEEIIFDDFDAIAFCPQANNKADPLYDPLMAAPYTCVNLTSDVFSFAMFVRDNALLIYNKEVFELPKITQVKSLLKHCVYLWHRIAIKTIKNYEKHTDTSLCPIHVTADENRWVAFHKDPAFAETEKSLYSHELPNIYGQRLAERWIAHFEGREKISVEGIAQEGCPS
jgi:hypothetical protein